MLPSIDSDCIYMFNWVDTYGYGRHEMHRYNLRDGTMEILSNDPNPMLLDAWHYSYRFVTGSNYHRLNPPSLIQVLLDYCNGLT
jgi:hypothetical protein